MIREAQALAWRKWPWQRLFTYIDPGEIRSVTVMGKEAGQCFREAGWRECGVSEEGKVILEMLPAWADTTSLTA